MADVMLRDAGRNKIAVIKVVRELLGCGLKEGKDLVDGAPRVVLSGVDAARAQAAVQALQAAGARAELVAGAATGVADAIWDDASGGGGAAGGCAVWLLDAGRDKIAVIKIIREQTGWGLKEAKDCADQVPALVKSGLAAGAADGLKRALEAAGGRAELRR